MYFVLWLLLGTALTAPLILYCHRLKSVALTHAMGISLVIAALIYVAFAMVWGDTKWQGIELAGVAAYGLTYWLAVRYSITWLALGWLLHPLWDLAVHLFGPGVHIVPEWYAVACLSFDLVIATYILSRKYNE